MSEIALENFLIQDIHHDQALQIAQEGIFRDDINKKPEEVKFNAFFDQYGTKTGRMGYPSKDYINLTAAAWVSCPADFNKNGVQLMKKLVNAIKQGTQFAKQHGKEVGDLYQSGQSEKADDLLRQFNQIFAYFITLNQQWNRGQKAFNGTPEPVKDNVKRDTLKLVNDVAECMKWAAHEFEDYKVQNYESKALIKKIFNHKYSIAAFRRDPHVGLAAEVHAFCCDWIDLLWDNIYRQ